MSKVKIASTNIKDAIKSLPYRRDKGIVVLDAWMGKKFADNTRYLFEWLSENKDELKLKHVVWVTRSQSVLEQVRALGYEAYMLDSKEAEYYQKSAGYLLCNNASIGSENFQGEFVSSYSFGAKRINLWHGTGAIKTFNMASNIYKEKVAKHPLLYGIKNQIYSHSSLYRKIFDSNGGWGDCYFLTTSPTEKEKFQKCYQLPDSRFIVSGYPRNCTGIKLTEEENRTIEIIKSFLVSILYLPTFRDANSKFDFAKVTEQLEDTLRRKNILLIQKAHAAAADNISHGLDGNVLSLDPDFDINVLTPIVTYVMTDYSSILADAIYHYKPVLLYVPDYDEYMKGERGFSSDAEYLLSAGTKFYNIEDLISYLEKNAEYPETAKTEVYQDVRKRIWSEDKDMKQIWNDIVEATK